MVRGPLLIAAGALVFLMMVAPVAAQSTLASPARTLASDGGEDNTPAGGAPPAKPDCVGRNSDEPCPPEDQTRPGGADNSDVESRPDGGGIVIYLPPLLADLLGNGRTGVAIVPPRRDPGPRPPRVDGSGPPVRLVPPSAVSPPRKVAIQAVNRAAAPEAPVSPDPSRSPRVRPRATSGDFVAREVLAVVRGEPALAEIIAAANGLTVLSLRQSVLLGGSVARFFIPDDRSVGLVLAQIEADGRAGRPEPNHVFGLQQAQALPQYAFERMALEVEASAGAGIAVAVVDSAVEADHPALAGAIAATHDALPETPVVDRQHGTSIVGLIAGRGQVKGTAPGAIVYHSRAFEGGQSTMDAILRSLDWAAGHKVRIINMSFAGPRNRLMEAATDAARSRGIVLVAAAGNKGPGAPRAYPAAFGHVLAVTATDTENRLMAEANRGSYVFVAAPGVEVAAPVPGGIGFVTGTSMAAAVLSGGIAGLIGADPSRGPRWIERALATTAVDLGPPGRDHDFGFGLANFAAAKTVP